MSPEITVAIALCNEGFQNNDRGVYVRIIPYLQRVWPQSSHIEKAIRLCDAGMSCISPRFAYPHIEDALNDHVREHG